MFGCSKLGMQSALATFNRRFESDGDDCCLYQIMSTDIKCEIMKVQIIVGGCNNTNLKVLEK